MKDVIKSRTKAIGMKVINLVEQLPNKPAGWVLSRQILRSSTAIGANYRAVCRAKSTADFINKLKIVEEEADETIYWLELIQEAEMIDEAQARDLIRETSEVLAIIVSSIKTTRERHEY